MSIHYQVAEAMSVATSDANFYQEAPPLPEDYTCEFYSLPNYQGEKTVVTSYRMHVYPGPIGSVNCGKGFWFIWTDTHRN